MFITVIWIKTTVRQPYERKAGIYRYLIYYNILIKRNKYYKRRDYVARLIWFSSVLLAAKVDNVTVFM